MIPDSAVRAAAEALNARDLDGYLAAFTPDCLRWMPGVQEQMSLSEVRAGLDSVQQAVDDFLLQEVILFSDSRYVCAHWRMTATHSGDFVGLAPTGRPISADSRHLRIRELTRRVGQEESGLR